MQLSVIGIGHLGLTHAVCMADLGHDVVAIDADGDKVSLAAMGDVPFFEPGLTPLLRKNLDSGRLHFTTSYSEVAKSAQVHFLCVGTPQSRDGAADLTYVHAAAAALAPHLKDSCLVVGKSTVPPGTARQVMSNMRATAPAGDKISLAWNPEFLREGFAIQDTLNPDRLIFGVTSESDVITLREVYRHVLKRGTPWLAMDVETAELVKVSANAFLATKISFINEMAAVCEAIGADVMALATALSYDDRIGKRSLSPGVGFGGGCLPKDIRAFRVTGRQLGLDTLDRFLSEVETINMERRARLAGLAREMLEDSLLGKRVAVLGLAFKPNSDDVRDSPSLDVCRRLVEAGAIVSVHDPVAIRNASQICPDLRYRPSVAAAAEAADLVVHITEWAEYRAIDPSALAAVVARPNMIDARCVLDAELWRAAGWSVRVLGQP
jgi:UDPglucose 6-dehydrogenase